MFADSDHNTLQHSADLDNGYALSAFVGFDSRPDGIKEIFVTKEINEAGIYGMRMTFNGKEGIADCDDRIPVKKMWRYGRFDWFPAFAWSEVEGEVWPMIAEKIWAKLNGSYAWSAGGRSDWVMKHLSNSPSETLMTDK